MVYHTTSVLRISVLFPMDIEESLIFYTYGYILELINMVIFKRSDF